MMRLLGIAATLLTVLLTGVLVAGFVAWQDSARATAQEANTSEEVFASTFESSARGLRAAKQSQQFLGARSCAAAACHGRIKPDDRFPLSQRNEYVSWLDHDPHARAYQTLDKPSSQKIIRRLETVDDNGRVTNREAVLANCYGCHNPQPAAQQQGTTFFQRDGVSCEICHGPAQDWIGEHVSAGWSSKTPAAKGVHGFLNTDDPLSRAQTCAQCHVGSPNREVNHDLIAAGHPVLRFEFAAYHDMLPKHWRSKAERNREKDFELQLWSAGQIAAAEAALKLLQWRVDRSGDETNPGVWPEFAEYDCYACHHDLVHPSWRQNLPSTGRTSGMAAWGGWYFSMPKQMTRLGTGSLVGWNANLQKLTTKMQTGFGKPDQALQHAIADALSTLQAIEALPAGKHDAQTLLAGDLRGTFGALAAEMESPPADNPGWPTTWDEATQLYAGLAAVEQAMRDELAKQGKTLPDDERTGIEELRGKLVFRKGFDSAKDLFTTPDPTKSQQEFAKSLGELIRRIEQMSTRAEADTTE
jgi:hypothetical protein